MNLLIFDLWFQDLHTMHGLSEHLNPKDHHHHHQQYLIPNQNAKIQKTKLSDTEEPTTLHPRPKSEVQQEKS